MFVAGQPLMRPQGHEPGEPSKEGFCNTMHARDASNRPRGVDLIYRELRDRICLLRYPPGSMLSENALADEFGVSRTPIRQALQRLEFEGLVVSRHGVGTMVRTVDLQYLREVYALRLKLIDLIAEIPPARITDDDLELLTQLAGEARELRDRRDPEALARVYHRFNEELSLAIGNQPLREIADRLFWQTTRVWLQLLPEMTWEDEVDYIVDEIESVLQALRRDDMEGVAAVRRKHMVLCLGRINSYLEGPILALP
ncbi:MAG: GntR family transcriptional regulator [Deinococcales bacterium]